MADASNMKRFYTLLAVVAAVGIGLLVWQINRSSAVPIPVAVSIQPSDTAGFPGYILGADSAPVEVIEYADYQCPACQQFAMVEWPYVRDRLVQTGKVKWVFKDFPLSQHPWAPLAAHAAACGAEQDQDKFWVFHDAIFRTQPEWSPSRDAGRIFRREAERAGLDVGGYDGCMKSLKYSGRIQASAQAGNALGVNSTPSFVIGGRLYGGMLAYDQIRALVDSLSTAR